MSSILTEFMVYILMMHYLYVVVSYLCRSVWLLAIVPVYVVVGYRVVVCGYLQGVVLCICWEGFRKL